MWFPQLHQTYINQRNPSYLNSIFIGFTVPILNLWSIILPEFLLLSKDLISSLVAIIIFPLIGLIGFANAKNITSPERDIESTISELIGKDITIEEFRSESERYIAEAGEVFKQRLRLSTLEKTE